MLRDHREVGSRTLWSLRRSQAVALTLALTHSLLRRLAVATGQDPSYRRNHQRLLLSRLPRALQYLPCNQSAALLMAALLLPSLVLTLDSRPRIFKL